MSAQIFKILEIGTATGVPHMLWLRPWLYQEDGIQETLSFCDSKPKEAVLKRYYSMLIRGHFCF